MARDLFHETVKNALASEGWTITHDPYFIKTKLLKDGLMIDLGAERLIAAEKDAQKIAVEVKSFLNDSLITDFYTVLGQILTYQINLEVKEPERILFLALPLATYQKMQEQPFYEIAKERYNLHFIVINEKGEVVTWHQ